MKGEIRGEMRGETSKLGWAWKEKQVNKDKHERRNK